MAGIVQISMSMPTQGLASIAPTIQAHFHLDLVRTGLVPTSVNLGITTTMLLWDFITDRVSERWTLSLGLGGSAAFLALAALTPGYLGVLGALVLAGTLGSAANAGSGRAIMAWFPFNERGMALGVRQMAAPLGAGLASIVLPVVALRYGFGAALWFVAACVGLAALAAALFVRSPSTELEPQPPAPRAGSPLRDERLWRLTAAAALLVATQSAFVTYLTLFLTGQVRLAITVSAALLATVQLTGGVGRLFVGRLSDSLGHRIRLLRGLVLGGAGTMALTGLAVGLPPPLIALLLLVGGWLLTASFGLSYAAASDMVGAARVGTAFGLIGTVTSAGAFVGPTLFGLGVTALGWRWGYAGLAASSFAIWWLLRPLVGQERRAWAREEAVTRSA